MADDPSNGAWQVAVTLTDVTPDMPAACTLGKHEIAVFLVEGTYFATSNLCTHAEALLTDGLMDGCEIECPLHNARFDVRTGKVLSSPAEVDLETFATRVVGGHVEVLIPD